MHAHAPVLPGADLVELRLSSYQLFDLPAALSTATALTSLDLTAGSLMMTVADVDNILAQLPALRRLRMEAPGETQPSVFVHLGRRLPQLEVV